MVNEGEKEMPKLEVEITEEELKDLEEFCKHHPDTFSNVGEALKYMAGIKNYRTMKKRFDAKRRKSPILYQDIGLPTVIPCALDEVLKKNKLTYGQFIKKIMTNGILELNVE